MASLFVCATGFALGFFFRVPAVLAMGLVLFVVTTAIGWLQGAPWLQAATRGIIALVLLEAAYLAGLMMSFALSRRARRR